MKMGVNKMTGTVWHKERVHRAEHDDRRYKGRCKYYNFNNKYCSEYCTECKGSAHCDIYCAVSEEEFKRRQQVMKKKNNDDDTYWY